MAKAITKRYKGSMHTFIPLFNVLPVPSGKNDIYIYIYIYAPKNRAGQVTSYMIPKAFPRFVKRLCTSVQEVKETVSRQ